MPAPTLTLGSRLIASGVVGSVAAVALAMNPSGYNPFGPPKAFALVVCALLVAIGLALDPVPRRRLIASFRDSWVPRIAAGLWVLIACSSVVSTVPAQSLSGSYPEYMGVIAWLAATVIACGAAALPWPEAWTWVSRALTAVVVVVGVYAVVQILGFDPVTIVSGSYLERVRSTLGNSSNAGVYLVFVLPLLVERLRRDPVRAWRAAAAASTALALFMVVFTESRGAWLGLAAEGAVWLGFEVPRWSPARRRAVLVAAAAAVLLFATAVLAVPRLQNRIAPASGGTIEWRLQVWQASARMVAARPLLGWGPNAFRSVYPSFRPLDPVVTAGAGATTGDPHNVVVSAAVSLGVPAALALLALMGAAGVDAVRLVRGRRDEDLRPVALAAGLAGGLVALMFHYATLDTLPVAASLIGLLIAARTRPDPLPAGADPKWTALPAAGLAVVLGLCAVGAGGILVADMELRDALALAAGGSTWSAVSARLSEAARTAPWEPTFTWAIGKAAISAVGSNGDARAYADGQAALSAVRRALPLESGVAFDSASLMYRYGATHADAALIGTAAATLAQLTTNDPNNAEYVGALGVAEAALGRFPDAERDLRKAVALTPGRSAYANALSKVLSRADSKK